MMIDGRASRLKNEIGNKYKLLTVIERAENIGTVAAWLCNCECGNTTIVKGKNLRNGNTKSCGCIKIKPRGEASFNFLYASRRRDAINRKKDWTLTKKEFKYLTKRNCFYCGIEPTQVFKQNRANGSYTYNGVDRINSSKGYVQGNVRPCCATCNRAKNVLTEGEFGEWLIKIYDYFITIGWNDEA